MWAMIIKFGQAVADYDIRVPSMLDKPNEWRFHMGVVMQADFDAKLTEAGNKLVVVDFYATWCGPCKMIAPYLEKLSGEHKDVVFLKVDVDENEDLASEYQVQCMPTFIFIKNRDKVGVFSGASEEKLLEQIISLK
ncbi:TXN [Cordylochernes scorpioides]|uniref:TXN n=1 Tax=Cordylochernes scorpioides TaxID=51811 RepID=A0ABY6KIZ4_9ARAC|nr:TXN [Cordylochernes scorpioides]